MALSSIAKSAATALAVAICLAAPASPDPAYVDALSPEEMRSVAEKAVQSGYSRLALEVTEALLRRDDADLFALLVQSRAARNLEQYDTATEAARAAWQLSEADAEKYASAMAMAQALASDNKRTRAQLWLRRASHVAPNEATRNAAIRDFRYVRNRNPWSAELNFSVSPTNNVNNGSARETTELFGLPFEFALEGAAQALEGIEYSAGVAARYRFDNSELRSQDLVFQASHRTYTLSDAAKAQAPGVKGSDFAFSQVAAGYTYQRRVEKGGYAFNVTGGQSWEGGDPYFRYLQAMGQRSWSLGDGTRLHLNGFLERQFGQNTADADRFGGTLSLTQKLGEMGHIQVHVGTTTSVSATDIGDYSELRGGIGFTLAKPVFGTEVSFGLDVRERDFIRSRYDPAGRRDSEVRARVDVVFKEVDAYGFNPTLTVTAAETDSTVGLFDSNSLGVRLGIRSAF